MTPNTKTPVVRAAAVVAALITATYPVRADITLDYTAGTNAVAALASNVQNAGSVLLPIVVAIILVMGAIGVYYRFARKAKVGT